MFKLKNCMYNYLVKKNGRVWYEYERYVREHMEEHRLHRFRHLRVLIKLNWFYRVKKGNTPYLYWDVPLEPNVMANNNNLIDGINPGKANEKTFELEYNKPIKRKKAIDLAEDIRSYEVISFDIFDTLIFRNVDDPKIIFDIVGLRLGIANYRQYREDASKEAKKYTLKKNKEADIFEICDYLSRYIGIDSQVLIDAEFEAEMDYCYANPYFLQVISFLADSLIIAVSDMYWPKEYLIKLLKKCGYTIEKVFVSCDCECAKRSGELQNYVTQTVGMRKSYIHIGDSVIADIKPSKEYGWDAIHYYNCNFDGNKFRSNEIQSISGSIYKAIINNYVHNGTNTYNKFFEHGFINAGYLAYAFCEWISEYVRQSNIDKAVFLGRDCFVIYKIFREYFSDIDSEYMKFSRFLGDELLFSEMPEIFIENNIKKRAFWPEKDRVKISKLFEQVGLEFLTSSVEIAGLSGDELANPTNYDKIRQFVYDNKTEIKNNFQPVRTAAYKEMSKVFADKEKILIVDLGWRGSAVFTIDYLVNKVFGLDKTIYGALMFGDSSKYERLMEESKKIKSFVYSSFSNKNLMGIGKKYSTYKLFVESTFSAPEPTLLRYKLDKEGNIVYEYGLLNAKSKDIVDIHDGMLEFARLYNTAIKKDDNLIHSNAIDAYIPLSDKLNNFEYAKYIFGDFIEAVNSTQGLDVDAKFETMNDILKKRELV